MHEIDLIFFTVAIYGLSWFVTKSSLFQRPRMYICERSPLLTALLSCIVCTAVWISLLVSLFSPVIPILDISPALADLPMLLGWTMGSTWIIARLVGDAE